MKKGIYIADMDKPASYLIEKIRMQISDARGQLGDVNDEYKANGIEDVQGTLTAALVYLHSIKEDLYKRELAKNNAISYSIRGIGSDNCNCFICGGERGLVSNISGYVNSKADGEKVVALFNGNAFLDYREREPNYIQVKIGACKKHKVNLTVLSDLLCERGMIFADLIERAKETVDSPE